MRHHTGKRHRHIEAACLSPEIMNPGYMNACCGTEQNGKQSAEVWNQEKC